MKCRQIVLALRAQKLAEKGLLNTDSSLWEKDLSMLEKQLGSDAHIAVREHLDKIAFAIKRGIREGRVQKDIAKDIRNHTDLSKRRAQLVARNAPLQYSGALTKPHQTSSGIKHYRWQTSQDERVRDSHPDRNNNVYSWNDPCPHPRSEVNCRCDAVPILQ